MARLVLSRLERAKSRLGEAILDPGLWPSLMEDVCAATATAGAALLQSDIRTPDVPMTPSVVESFRAYFDTNLHVNDVRAQRGVPILLSGRRTIRDQDLFSSESPMLRDPLYANLTRFGLRWFCAISFSSGPALWAMTLQRRVEEGKFEDHEMKALASLSDSLTEVASLSRAVGRKVLLGSLNAFALINESALALSSTGRVLEYNRCAADLFDADFRVRDGRIFLRDKDASDALERLISEGRSSSELRLSRERSSRKLVVARRLGKRPISIQVLPVHGAARGPFLGARFILTLRDLDAARQPPAKVLAEAFSLTPAEAQVASLIAAGLSPETMADQLHLSRETVRNQIKAVFAKTGTHRQNELTALILRLQS